MNANAGQSVLCVGVFGVWFSEFLVRWRQENSKRTPLSLNRNLSMHNSSEFICIEHFICVSVCILEIYFDTEFARARTTQTFR